MVPPQNFVKRGRPWSPSRAKQCGRARTARRNRESRAPTHTAPRVAAVERNGHGSGLWRQCAEPQSEVRGNNVRANNAVIEAVAGVDCRCKPPHKQRDIYHHQQQQQPPSPPEKLNNISTCATLTNTGTARTQCGE
jgi:hypothetical protein